MSIQKSPLAPLFQRGEQQHVASAAPIGNTPASPFEKGGLRGICRCAISCPLNEVWVA